MHREMRALRAAVEMFDQYGTTADDLAAAARGTIQAYDCRPRADAIERLRVARRRAMDSGDIELLTHVVDQITGGVLPASPVEQNVSYGFNPPSDFKVRKVASILAPHADDDGISTKTEIAALRMELASLFCRVAEWTGDRMERDTTSITRGGVTRFEVEVFDAPGENDLRRVAARAARSFRQPDGIAIRLPDGSTYRIDAEGVAR